MGQLLMSYFLQRGAPFNSVYWRDGDRLTYQLANRAVRAMAPLGQDRCLAQDLDGFRRELLRDDGGHITHLHDQWLDGHVESNRQSESLPGCDDHRLRDDTVLKPASRYQ